MTLELILKVVSLNPNIESYIMKSKTVKIVLRKKFDEFLKSITDKKVRKLVKNNSIITGGAIASMLLAEDVNDYDIYFTNAKTVRAVAHYYTEKFNTKNGTHEFQILDGTVKEKDLPHDWEEMGIIKGRIKIRVTSLGVASEQGFQHSESPQTPDKGHSEDTSKSGDNYRPVFISSNAITLANDIQLIVRFFGDAEEIHSNYDFTHCTCVWESKTGKLTMPSEALECLLSKELRYQGSKYPLASVIRTRKFINRGWMINAGQYLKMCMQLNEIDLRDISILEDQLTGVDAYYFSLMLECIDAEKLRGADTDYFISLIDRFF